MPVAPLRPRVGLLALTLELYESLAPGLREGRERWLREQVLPALDAQAEVIFDRAVYQRQQVEAAVAALEAAGAEALLVVCLTYSPSQIALPALQRTRLPLIVWNTQELWAVDETFSGQQMVDNHGVHGTQDLGNVLLRSGVPFQYVTSHLRNGLGELTDCLVAAAAAQRLRRSRLGLLGYPFPGMGDFALDTTYLAATLGCEWTVLPLEEYVQRAAEAPPEAVEALVAEYRDRYALAPEVTEADLVSTARVEIALRGMVEAYSLAGFSYQFLAFGEDERTPTVPFVATSRLLAEGIGFGGEGDLIAAAGTALLGWLQPPATFAEMFTMDFAGNAVLFSHMGEANVQMARSDRPVPLTVRPAPITRTRDRQLALVVSLAPGPATLCALTLGPAQRWRLVVAPLDILDYGPLPALEVPHWKMSPSGDVRDFLSAYAQAGGPHHCAVCFGDARPRLRRLAAILGADYVEV